MKNSFHTFSSLPALLVLTFCLSSCVKDKPPVKEETATIGSGKRIFITNEGNYNWGNASVSLYDPNNLTVVEDIYKPNNNNSLLGDVCQSMIRLQNKLLVVINNSHKIVALNSSSFAKEKEISGLNSPRYILPVSNSKAYISDLYNNALYIADLSNWSISGTIPCAGWTECMTLSYGKAFVCNLKSNYLYVINTASDQITDSINVGYGSASLQKDMHEKIWLICRGNSVSGQTARLVRINPLNHQVEFSKNFPTGHTPGNLQININGNQLYFLDNGVYTMSINDTDLPLAPLIAEGTKVFYGLGIDPEDESIYVADAIDYVQKGKIEHYNTNGSIINSFSAGITPGSFFFDY